MENLIKTICILMLINLSFADPEVFYYSNDSQRNALIYNAELRGLTMIHDDIYNGYGVLTFDADKRILNVDQIRVTELNNKADSGTISLVELVEYLKLKGII